RMIGFLTEAELEFFELFCTVDKVGVRKAIKALVRPIRDIADAIQRQDAKWLTTLPGVGAATAEQIVATLSRKITKFALMPARPDALRPRWLQEVIVQKAVVQKLRVLINACKKLKEPMSHILFDGPPGLGKTTFATVLPNELGTTMQMTSGPALSKPGDMMPFLTNATEGSILFVDEIHRMPRVVEEFIYPAMEDFRVDIVLGEGINARTISLKLKHFTLVGATTRSGMLSSPMRDRFKMHEHLEFYSIDELAEIVRINARKLRTELPDEAALELARRSRGTPRIANARLWWTRSYAAS